MIIEWPNGQTTEINVWYSTDPEFTRTYGAICGIVTAYYMGIIDVTDMANTLQPLFYDFESLGGYINGYWP